MERRWTRLCAEFARDTGIPAHEATLVEAFGCGEPAQTGPGSESFAALEVRLDEACRNLPAEIARRLSGEVDPEQAAMFGRRFHAVADVLATLSRDRPLARLLRVALACRARELLEGDPPRALRVRALVDFHYSQAAVLHHRRPGDAPPGPEELARQAHWTPVVPGLEVARLVGPSTRGPLHAHALRARGLRLEARDVRAAAARGGAFARIVRDHGAVAGISGGYFLYSEPDILPPSRRTDPVGLLLHEGEVATPPSFRRAALLQDGGAGTWIEVRGPVGLEIEGADGHVLRVDACNAPDRMAQEVVAFNRAFGEAVPEHGGWTLGLVGTTVVALGRGGAPIPLAGLAVTRPERPPGLGIGSRVRYRLPPGPNGLQPREAMAGGPMLVHAGRPTLDLAAEDFAGSAPPVTFSRDETRGRNLLPRMAAGVSDDGDLLLLAVDGRNFERAPGVTLDDLAAMMASLGAVEAMNLDGGSSKRMVVQGRTLDLPSTEVEVAEGRGPVRVRPVHSAILLFERG